jgi:methylglutaconyl-CoA hydratase
MENALVIVDRSHPHCTVLTFNRPAKRNALTIALMENICDAIIETQNLPDQRVIILKGAGSVFCAGLDLSEAENITLEESSSKAIGRMLKTIYECPLITIAAVHGAALAGGAGIVCTCDLAIAETGTIFGFPEIRRGLIAAQIMPFILQVLPHRMLKELIFLGDHVEAHRAYEIGLINRVAKTYSSLPEALKFVESIIKGAPQAMKKAKKFIQQLEQVNFEEGFKRGVELHREIRQGEEAKEGMKAFLEKRPPQWM